MARDSRATQMFAAFASLHVVMWTVLPTAVRYVTPMDATEAAAWGHHLVLGYPRNPWLSAWLARGALTLSAGADWSLYLLSQLCVLVAMTCLYRLASTLMNRWHALASVLALAAVQSFSIAAIDFNDNVLQLALWPAAVLSFHCALTSQRARAWLLTGALAGLAMVAKYSSVLLLLAMLAFLVLDVTARTSFRRPAFYAALGALALVVAPHTLWLVRHDFLTVRYFFERVESFSAPWWEEHLGYAAKFAFNQLLTVAPAAALFATLWWRPAGAMLAPAQRPAPFARHLLAWLIGVPFLATLVISMLVGWHLRTMWGMPFVSLASLLLACFMPAPITLPTVRRLVVLCVSVDLLLGAGYAFAMARPGETRSANLPLDALAQDVTSLWRTRHHSPLAFVGGERLITSYVVRYSADQPAAFFDFDATRNPWLTDAQVRTRGAAFVQFVNYHGGHDTFADDVLRRFPTLTVEPVREYRWHRAQDGQEPLRVLIGLLPPALAR